MEAFDELSVKLLPFFMTNARKSAVVYVEGGGADSKELAKKLRKSGLTDKIDVRMEKYKKIDSKDGGVFNEIVIGAKKGGQIEFAMAGQFVSLYLCVGHIKSTKGDDEVRECEDVLRSIHIQHPLKISNSHKRISLHCDSALFCFFLVLW